MILLQKQLMIIIVSFQLSMAVVHADVITLESHVIGHIDGVFIKADLIEFIQKSRKTIINLLQYHNLKELVHQEKMTPHAAHLTEKIAKARADFLMLTKNFVGTARGAKHLITLLIEEDCTRRNRPDSLLLNWAHTPEGLEEATFNKDMTTALALYTFCVDLANFLNDLTHSCPKARMHFQERREKEHALFVLLPDVIIKTALTNTKETYVAFLKYVKKNFIDHLHLEEITPLKVEELLAAFIKQSTRSSDITE